MWVENTIFLMLNLFVHHVTHRLYKVNHGDDVMLAKRSLPNFAWGMLSLKLCFFNENWLYYNESAGARCWWRSWLRHCATSRKGVRFPIVSLEFFIDIILPAALWPWVWLSLWQKWVPGIFSWNKGGRCIGLTILPLSCADCLEIWELQPPGTLRACPGL